MQPTRIRSTLGCLVNIPYCLHGFYSLWGRSRGHGERVETHAYYKTISAWVAVQCPDQAQCGLLLKVKRRPYIWFFAFLSLTSMVCVYLVWLAVYLTSSVRNIMLSIVHEFNCASLEIRSCASWLHPGRVEHHGLQTSP